MNKIELVEVIERGKNVRERSCYVKGKNERVRSTRQKWEGSETGIVRKPRRVNQGRISELARDCDKESTVSKQYVMWWLPLFSLSIFVARIRIISF